VIDHDIPGDAPQPPPEPPITTTGDLRFEEWKECRDLIGRLDGTLADLRKYGFSLVTTLLTAGGIVTSLTNGRPARAVASEVIMVLVAALFGLDAYYSTALGGAVDRALNLELLTRPRIWVTWYLRVSVVKAKSLLLTVTLYIALLATSLGLGLLSWHGSSPIANGFLVGTFALLLLFITLYTTYVWHGTGIGGNRKDHRHYVRAAGAGADPLP
jgi:hypothetical protein